MSNPQKICPECGKAAAITAATCANCAHAFSTKFPAAERTQALSPAAFAPFVPVPARPHPSGISTLLIVIGAGTLGIIALVLAYSFITSVAKQNSGSHYQEFNHGVVALSDAQAAAIYPGEDARQVYEVQIPDYIEFPSDGSPNPHAIETWFWNLPHHHRLALIIGDNHVRAINAFDENGDNIRHEIDGRWYQSVSSEQ